MPFEFKVPMEPTAIVFPGQGAQSPMMLEPFRHAQGFRKRYDQVCQLLGWDVLEGIRRTPESLNRNDVSSLLAVLAGVLCLDLVREIDPAFSPVATAGYSVGQWTALLAAGVLSVDDLFTVVYERARLMDACVDGADPSGMLAVIGVRAQDVAAVCEAAASLGQLLQITNYNAPGQFTLGGTEQGLRFAEERLAALRPKRLQRVPVAAAWHSRLLVGVVPRLAILLERVPLKSPGIPVIDNTTGGWLPGKDDLCRAALARQVASPVLWTQGVETLIGYGVRHIVEIGYGDLLTRFGFFINRSLRHEAVVPPPRVPT